MAKEETVRAVVLRDYWAGPEETSRVRAGTIVEVTKDDLIDGMEKGILARAKD
jgi:hypothetical protein